MKYRVILLTIVMLLMTCGKDDEEDTWTNTYGGSGDEIGYSVQQTSDRGFIFAGRTSSFGAGSHDICLVKTDEAGYYEWSRMFGGSSYDVDHSVQQTTDGELYGVKS